MRRRQILPLLVLPLLATNRQAQAQAQGAAEFGWTRVAPADLDRFEASFADLRVTNLVVEREDGSDPAGPATSHEFAASVANRNRELRRVAVQIVGVRQDGTPTLSVQGSVDVEGRRNDSIRAGFMAPEKALEETVAYYVRAMALPMG